MKHQPRTWLAAVIAITAIGLTACSDPSTSTSATSAANAPVASSNAAATSGGSAASASAAIGGSGPVASVAALVPEEYKTKTIQNAIYNNSPPQEFLDGDQLVGVQPDFAAALAEVMGVKIENQSVGSFDTLIPGLTGGRYDMSSAYFGITKDRLAQVDFVSEFAVGTGFATKNGSGITINTATDLCGHSVGVVAGTYFIDQITQANTDCSAAGKDPITLQTYPDDGARILAINNGRTEVTATTSDLLAYQIQTQGAPLTLQTFVYQPVEDGIALANESPLGPALEAAMKEIVSNGTYAAILAKWGVPTIGYTTADQVNLYTDPSQFTPAN